jgi:hypothetical protein
MIRKSVDQVPQEFKSRKMNDPYRDTAIEPVEEDLPGDPVCLLRRVCQRCGAVADHDPPTTCPSCHAEMPAD